MKIRVCVILSALWLSQTQASAARFSNPNVPIRYTVTDLGASYQFEQAADGSIESVTAADGLSTFAFSKVPVQYNPQGDRVHRNGGSHDYELENILRIGNLSAGTSHVESTISGMHNYFRTPAWRNGGISDMNASGSVVGNLMSDSPRPGSTDYEGHAAVFLEGQPQQRNMTSAFDLNYMIDDFPVSLTSAVKIDDLGRIIAASGYIMGHETFYLLTPKELGPAEPLTVPEPSTLVVLGGMVAFGAMRTQYRRRK